MNFWLQLFLANWLLNILAVEFLAIRKIQPLMKHDPAREQKYHAFRRDDAFWFSRWWLYPMCHLAVAKVLWGFFTLIVVTVVIHITLLFHEKD